MIFEIIYASPIVSFRIGQNVLQQNVNKWCARKHNELNLRFIHSVLHALSLSFSFLHRSGVDEWFIRHCQLDYFVLVLHPN